MKNLLKKYFFKKNTDARQIFKEYVSSGENHESKEKICKNSIENKKIDLFAFFLTKIIDFFAYDILKNTFN